MAKAATDGVMMKMFQRRKRQITVMKMVTMGGTTIVRQNKMKLMFSILMQILSSTSMSTPLRPSAEHDCSCTGFGASPSSASIRHNHRRGMQQDHPQFERILWTVCRFQIGIPFQKCDGLTLGATMLPSGVINPRSPHASLRFPLS